MKVKALTGHVSPETAYVVADYPYGFRLRCQIRYWIESHPRLGFRSCSQTTNPKREGTHWNAPKKETYCYVALGMFLNEDEHVKFAGCSQYSDLKEAQAYLEKWGDCLNPDAAKKLETWIKLKEVYEARRDAKAD